MKRIAIVALIVNFATIGAFPASRAKKRVTRTPSASAETVVSVPLEALFPAPASQEIVGPGGMVTMAAPNHEVVMVRINGDGTRSYACVNTESAARSFLSAPKSGTATVKQEQ